MCPCRSWLKHGTGAAKPEVVYKSTAGFDFRYSRDTCFFGMAAYFAERAVYSDAYAYSVPQSPGQRQMFIARVAAGKAQPLLSESDRNSAIKHPPPGYHSIRGNVAPGSFAYMVYETNHAYPAYLVTYMK